MKILGNNSQANSYIKVFETIAELQLVHAKSHLDLDNIETLMGVVEMARVINRLGKKRDQEIETVRDALVNVIVDTLESNIKYPVKEQYIYPPQSYANFARLIYDMEEVHGIQTSAAITFNYDISLDFAISHKFSEDIEYCTSDQVSGRGIKLFKLHGSLNWGRCDTCLSIRPFSMRTIIQNINRNYLGRTNSTETLRVASALSSLECCKIRIGTTPVIIPPTWNKKDYHGSITNVWQRAADALASAENIFVIGYSLPESDSFFRYLFALGTASPARVKRFWVFDPDTSGTVKERYQRLLGRGIINRFDYIPKRFSEVPEYLRQQLGVKNRRS